MNIQATLGVKKPLVIIVFGSSFKMGLCSSALQKFPRISVRIDGEQASLEPIRNDEEADVLLTQELLDFDRFIEVGTHQLVIWCVDSRDYEKDSVSILNDLRMHDPRGRNLALRTARAVKNPAKNRRQEDQSHDFDIPVCLGNNAYAEVAKTIDEFVATTKDIDKTIG